MTDLEHKRRGSATERATGKHGKSRIALSNVFFCLLCRRLHANCVESSTALAHELSRIRVLRGNVSPGEEYRHELRPALARRHSCTLVLTTQASAAYSKVAGQNSTRKLSSSRQIEQGLAQSATHRLIVRSVDATKGGARWHCRRCVTLSHARSHQHSGPRSQAQALCPSGATTRT